MELFIELHSFTKNQKLQVMKLTKEQLTEKGAYYFENKEVQVMFATPDGQFFHANARQYADGHAASINEEVITIERSDLKSKKTATADKKEEEKKPLEKMTVKELEVEVKALEGIDEDEIEAVMSLSPKSKIADYVKSYEAPAKEDDEEETASDGGEASGDEDDESKE